MRSINQGLKDIHIPLIPTLKLLSPDHYSIERAFIKTPKIIFVRLPGDPWHDRGRDKPVLFGGSFSVSYCQSIRPYGEERIAKNNVPALFRFIDEMPKTPAGKILKQALRDQPAEKKP